MIFLMGCTAGIISFAARTLRTPTAANTATETSFSFGWWNLLLVPLSVVAGLIVFFLCALLLNYLLELIEYLMFVARKCPKCGARRWSWGFTRGFGL
ncbi:MULTISPECIES: hypothetical protein [Rhodopirellula]|jgi:hypothetical protein|nr:MULTISPECIES: hypothetical protein [Rhodopirellula]|tara:strand:- start:33 stop:323 length:291 start_codon:yes stop_codon:yes gene_type:complete